VRRFRNPQPDEQIDIPDLTVAELATYNSWARRFDRDEARWLTKEKALRTLSLEIVQTIDIKHLDLILDCADAYSQLRTLKKHLCPSIGERNHQLRARYRAVCTRPERANLDTWFDEWVTITRLLTEAKMPETTGNRAQSSPSPHTVKIDKCVRGSTSPSTLKGMNKISSDLPARVSVI
jgi:hypothetical protein